jgi:FkbM family methyltransferase
VGIGAQSPFWRRMLFDAFATTYFRRKLETEHGVVEAYVSPGSSLKVLSPKALKIDPAHDRFIQDWISSDAVVWDIGANVGLFALPAASKAKNGLVYAFEPDVDLNTNLLRSLRLPRNSHLQVSLFSVALSDVDGTANFQISKFSRAMNKLEAAGTWHDDQVVPRELGSVITMRIDTLAQTLRPPTAMKIDVEGAEMQVLRGGRATITKCRPAILIEGPQELQTEMGAYFREIGYVLLDGAAPNPDPLELPVWDTIAVPAEKYGHP